MSSESHSLAVSIEWTLRGLFRCDRFGLGGFINSDSIEAQPMQSFRLGFATIYANASNERRELIDTFIDSNCHLDESDIDEIGVDRVSELHEEFRRIVGL